MMKINWSIVLPFVIGVLFLMYCINGNAEAFGSNEFLSNQSMDQSVMNNPHRYGYVPDSQARTSNMTARPEYCGAPGVTTFCKCGYPAKKIIDETTGSHHQLGLICTKCPEGISSPPQLGSWWNTNNVDSVGVNDRAMQSNYAM